MFSSKDEDIASKHKYLNLLIEFIMKNTTNNNSTKSIQDLKNFEIKKSQQVAVKGGVVIEDMMVG